MAHYLTGDERFHVTMHDDDPRSYLFDRDDTPIGYRFGRMHGKRARVHARRALRRASGYFRNMIEAIANAKLRRMERELELRGIRLSRKSLSD
jgi:hypothetical protein